MNRLVSGVLLFLVVFSAIGCQARLSDESFSVVPISITSSIDAVSTSLSKGVVAPTAALTGVQFLRQDGASTPSGFAGATLLVGNRSADGKVAFTSAVPTYNKNNQNAYFAAYYPAGVVASQVVTWPIDGKTDILVTKAVYDAGKHSAPTTGNTMNFKHSLAQLEVVCKADAGGDLSTIESAWGQITKIELSDTPTSVSYTYATNAVSNGSLGTLALLSSDYSSAFSPTGLSVNASGVVTAAGMFAPSLSGTAPLKLRVYTTTEPTGVEVLAQLFSGSNRGFVSGLRHTVTLVFKIIKREVVVQGVQISDWDLGDGWVGGSDLGVALPFVEINGLKWATGNLVATGTNSCKIGAPADYGLYFQFGSLVGWSGGDVTNGDGTGQGEPATVDKAVWPLQMGTAKPGFAWQSNDAASISTLANYYFNYSAAPWETNGQNIRGFNVSIAGDSGSGTLADGRYAQLGVGDPCTYYLGAPWRTPTTTELASITGQTGYSNIAWATAGLTGRWVTSSETFDGVSGPGGWFGAPLSAGTGTPSTANNPFFPASGNRSSSNGSLTNVTTLGYGWSSSVNDATLGLYLRFNSSWVYPQYGTNRSFGFPVRCVSGTYGPVNPPSASDYVTIGSLRWTKGNLVAKNTNECKVGAPADYGVYFQFGSLVGWTGGASGDGTGQGSPATVDKAVWPAAMGAAKPSFAWQSNNAASISTLAHYYFNYSVAPWETSGQNIRGFNVSIAGDSGSGTLADGRYAELGVGDPCTYYLGAPWRTPTTTEQASITGQTGSSGIAWATAGLTGRWATSSETFDGVSGPGAWFGTGLSAGTGTPSTANNAFFPASGYRLPSNGSFNSVTTSGYGWGSSVGSATSGLYLHFYSSWVSPQGGSHRSNGFPVRCVSSVP